MASFSARNAIRRLREERNGAGPTTPAAAPTVSGAEPPQHTGAPDTETVGRWTKRDSRQLITREIDLDLAGGSTVLRIAEDAGGAWRVGTGATVWDCSLALLRFLAREERAMAELAAKDVVELGAGCGVLGLGLAARGAGDGAAPRSVTLTERALCLPLLEVNAEANRATLGDEKRLAVREYSWGDRDGVVPGGPYQIVLGADLAYPSNCDAYDALATTIARTLRDGGEGAVLYLAHEPRKPDVERAFFELLASHGLDVRVVEKADDIALYRGVLAPRQDG